MKHFFKKIIWIFIHEFHSNLCKFVSNEWKICLKLKFKILKKINETLPDWSELIAKSNLKFWSNNLLKVSETGPGVQQRRPVGGAGGATADQADAAGNSRRRMSQKRATWEEGGAALGGSPFAPAQENSFQVWREATSGRSSSGQSWCVGLQPTKCPRLFFRVFQTNSARQWLYLTQLSRYLT